MGVAQNANDDEQNECAESFHNALPCGTSRVRTISDMKVSNKGLIAIANKEALVLSAYKDSVGVRTIGVGHTSGAGLPIPIAGMKLTPREAIELFRKDIAKFEAGVNRAVKVSVSQHEFDALVSFHFNTGGIGRAALTRHLNEGDRAKAADGFMGWVKPPEIKNRRLQEQKLFATGDYGDISRVKVYDKFPGPSRMVPASELFGSSTPSKPDGAVRGDPSVWHTQNRLKAMNYNPGEADGIWGGMTAGAIGGFINDRNLDLAAPTSAAMFGDMADALNKALTEAEAERFVRPVSEERSSATPDELGGRLPEVSAARRAEKVGWWASISAFAATVTTGITKSLGDAVEWLQPLKSLAGDVPWFFWIGGALAGSALLYYVAAKAGQSAERSTEAYNAGERL